MIELNTNTAADELFIAITSEEPTASRTALIDKFVRLYWGELSEEHKNAYRQVRAFNRSENTPNEAEYLAGEAAYNYGMARQDALLMDF